MDDDREILTLLVDLFRREGSFEVRTAVTGYEAGVLTERFRPDLLVLDFRLSDVNGEVVCRTIRGNAAHADTKILVVSGMAGQDDVRDLLESGADSFLRKPFDGPQLMRRVRSLLAVV